MIATCTDIKPVECLIFMRNVKSEGYFEHMEGRGVRTLSDAELRQVTPDAQTKTRFVPEFWSKGTVHWVSPKDMKRLLIDSAQDQITQKTVAESAANMIPKDSVLMVTRSGILEQTFPVSINTVEVAVNQDLKAWTLHRDINPVYAAYFLRSRGQHILDVCSKDGTTVSSIDF